MLNAGYPAIVFRQTPTGFPYSRTYPESCSLSISFWIYRMVNAGYPAISVFRLKTTVNLYARTHHGLYRDHHSIKDRSDLKLTGYLAHDLLRTPSGYPYYRTHSRLTDVNISFGINRMVSAGYLSVVFRRTPMEYLQALNTSSVLERKRPIFDYG